MDNKILTGILTSVVLVILVGSLLAPVINDATETERTFTNIGEYELTADDSDYHLIYDHANMELVANGEHIPFTALSNNNWTIVSTDAVFLRLANWASQSYALRELNGSTQYNHNVWVEFKFNSGVVYQRNSADGEFTQKYTYDTDSFRGIVATDGEYVCTNSNGATILIEDSVIAQSGTTTVDTWYNSFEIQGTITDMDVNSVSSGIEVSNVQVHYTDIDGWDAYHFESVTFTATSNTNSVNATYDRVIVPKEVTAQKDTNFDLGQIAIISAIVPIVLVAGLIVILPRLRD